MTPEQMLQRSLAYLQKYSLTTDQFVKALKDYKPVTKKEAKTFVQKFRKRYPHI